MVFSNGELAAVEDKSFSIEKNFDFYVVNDTIFIANKRGFETSIQHREAYIEAFSQLQAAPSFNSLFSDIEPIVKYVGNNSIQLRRMGVIEQKGIYNNPNFMPNLVRVSSARNWGINFDPTSKTIIPCSNTTGTILQVLLDHRLMSEITDNIYDVPDATEI